MAVAADKGETKEWGKVNEENRKKWNSSITFDQCCFLSFIFISIWLWLNCFSLMIIVEFYQTKFTMHVTLLNIFSVEEYFQVKHSSYVFNLLIKCWLKKKKKKKTNTHKINLDNYFRWMEFSKSSTSWKAENEFVCLIWREGTYGSSKERKH